MPGGRDRKRDSDADLVAVLKDALRPRLQSKTNAVVSRLGPLIAQRHNLDELATSGRRQRRRRQQQAKDILHRWDALHAAIIESDSAVQERLWAEGRGLPPPAQLESAFDDLRDLVRPTAGGRPRQIRRELILDAVVAALKAAGIPLTKTREGDTESVAHSVLNVLGEPEVDLHRDVMAAIDRFKDEN
jgi:hypothetical protein